MALLNIPFIHRGALASARRDANASPQDTAPDPTSWSWGWSRWMPWCRLESAVSNNNDPAQQELKELRSDIVALIDRGKVVDLYSKICQIFPTQELQQLVSANPEMQNLSVKEQLQKLIADPPPTLPLKKLIAAELQAVFLDSHLAVRHEYPADRANTALLQLKPLLAAQDRDTPLQYSNRHTGVAGLLHAHEAYLYPVGALLMRKASKEGIPAVMDTTHHDGIGWSAPLMGLYIKENGAGGGEVHTEYPSIPCRSKEPDILWTNDKKDKEFWKSCFTRLQAKQLRSDANIIMVVEDGYNGLLADDNPASLRRIIREAFDETIGTLTKTERGFTVPAYKLRFASSFSSAYRALEQQPVAGVVTDLFMPTRRDVGVATLKDIFSRLNLLSAEQLGAALTAMDDQRQNIETNLRAAFERRLAKG